MESMEGLAGPSRSYTTNSHTSRLTTTRTRNLLLSHSVKIKVMLLVLCIFSLLSCVQSVDLTWENVELKIQIPKESEFDMDTVELITVNYTSTSPIVIMVKSSDTEVAGIDGVTEFNLNSTTNDTTLPDDSLSSVSVNVSGTRFGRARLELDIIYYAADGTMKETMCLHTAGDGKPRCPEIVVLRVTSLVDLIFQICLGCVLVLVTGMMGCKLKWEYIRDIMKKPWDVIIGAIAQFLIMPAVAYGFCLAYGLDDDYAIGVILGASCPGGGLSNIACVLIDADVVLSIVLTFSTTVLALGMMPLCLWVYTSPFTDDETFPVPVRDIAIALGALIVPLAIGVIIRKQKPNWAKKILKILRPFCIVVFLILAVFGTISSRYIFLVSDRDMILCTFTFTTCGFILGLLAGIVCCRTAVQSKTIAIETGIKNSALALGIIAIVYPKPDADILTAVVLWYAAAQFFLILAMALVYAVTTRECFKKRFGNKVKSVDDDDDMDDDSDDNSKKKRTPDDDDDDDIFTVSKDPEKVKDDITAFEYQERNGNIAHEEIDETPAPVKAKKKKKKPRKVSTTDENESTATLSQGMQSEPSEIVPIKKKKTKKKKKKKKKVSSDDTEGSEEATPRGLPPLKTVSGGRIRQEPTFAYNNQSFNNDGET
ncbi:uncharacterized protein [Antedon mediterranea]|uniref:uncharacterized protein n=1 Tax=Antedon mediterranea TaxID=105859 RepID=UPI003AF95CFF